MSETRSSTDAHAGRRRPSLVAVLAAVAVLAGGGGTYMAAADDEHGESAGRTVLSDPRGGPAGTPAPGGSGSPGIAPGEPDPNTVGRYRVAGRLPEAPDRAHTYRDGRKATAADAARLARALGITVMPVKTRGQWHTGPQKDGSGPELWLNESGHWHYVARGPRSDDCPKGKRCPGNPSDGPQSERAAKRAVAPMLKALGFADAALYVEGGSRRVVAHPRIGGLPTHGYAVEFTVGAGGEVVAAKGELATLVRSETVPVTSLEQVVRDLNSSGRGRGSGDWRKGWPVSGDCTSSVPLPGGGMRREGGAASKAGGPCGPKTGGSERAQDVVTIRKVVLGLAPYSVRSGAALVPAWLFTAEEKGRTIRFSHPAVPLEQLSGYPPGLGMTVETPRAGTRVLRVTFPGKACTSYVVRAEESAARVGLRRFEVSYDKRLCIDIGGVVVHVTVPLDAPVGGRAVVDAESGEPFHQVAARR
ncbi:hypothetical protein LUX12_00030 [Streptomyces somaliensis]|uniref:hypothetical protein n=2 Tax=Streptomyces somaliensis TaxID=78355 RepID=UPI0020CD2D2B|nr:hypothetical protein [Streptomyces somaliensis]MCP9943555.1 hypothetical protein [Streptomyces somaliensis]